MHIVWYMAYIFISILYYVCRIIYVCIWICICMWQQYPRIKYSEENNVFEIYRVMILLDDASRSTVTGRGASQATSKICIYIIAMVIQIHESRESVIATISISGRGLVTGWCCCDHQDPIKIQHCYTLLKETMTKKWWKLGTHKTETPTTMKKRKRINNCVRVSQGTCILHWLRHFKNDFQNQIQLLQRNCPKYT